MKETVKMSITPWRHKWSLVRKFKHKNLIPVLHSTRKACLSCWSQASTECGHILLSQSRPRRRKHDSEPEFSPLLTPGCRGSRLPLCLGHGWGQGTPPQLLSLCRVLCTAQGHLEDICLILTLNTDHGSRKLLLWPYKRKDRFIALLIYATSEDNLTS